MKIWFDALQRINAFPARVTQGTQGAAQFSQSIKIDSSLFPHPPVSDSAPSVYSLYCNRFSCTACSKRFSTPRGRGVPRSPTASCSPTEQEKNEWTHLSRDPRESQERLKSHESGLPIIEPSAEARATSGPQLLIVCKSEWPTFTAIRWKPENLRKRATSLAAS